MSDFSLLTILPCHGWEDFPTHHKGVDAHGLLASLTALWHPHIVSRAQSIPRWCRFDLVPENCARTIVVVPSIAATQIPTGFSERAAAQNGLLIQSEVERKTIIARALTYMGLTTDASPTDLADDFLALGYSYVQVQLMTRQLRYSSHLDEVLFQSRVVAAAAAYAAGDEHECRLGLQSSFDLLAQERQRYFPVDALFIHLLLVAPTTLGDPLLSAIESPAPLNVLLTGELAELIGRRQPQFGERIRAKIAAGEVEILGGTAAEPRFTLLSLESLAFQFQRGRALFTPSIGSSPKSFARRRFGVTCVLPQLLKEFGYRGAIHALFDQGKYPAPSNSSIEWQAPDGTSIPAISASPVDAAQADAFTRLGVDIGESFDAAHGAMCLLAHWPGRTSAWFDDLLRTTKYGSVLGRFVTVHEFFQKTPFSGRRERYSQDQYRSEYLAEAQQTCQPNPISRVVDYWANRHHLARLSALELMAQILSGRRIASPRAIGEGTWDRLNATNESRIDGDSQIERAGGAAPGQANDRAHADDTAESANLANQIQSVYKDVVRAIGDCIAPAGSQSPSPHLIAVNPLGLARRVICPVGPRFAHLSADKPVYAADVGPGGGWIGLDVPPFGFAAISPATKKSRGHRPGPAVVDGLHLRNEFFDLEVDSRTGGLRSIHSYDRRGNLFSQMLTLRLPPGRRSTGGTDVAYGRPVARSWEAITNNSVVGELRVLGQIVVDEQAAADFEQRFRVFRGRRVIEIDIGLTPHEPLTNDPWRHYYCSRFAWPSQAAELCRGINETRCPIVESRFEAPQFIEIADPPTRVAILTNGLPFHRHYDYNKLDSILSVSGETCTRFRLGIGIDVPLATHAAAEFAAPPIVWETDAPLRVAQESAWLVRLDCRNLLVTSAESISGDAGTVGLRMRIKETEGRAGQGRLECAHSIVKAQRVRLDHDSRSELHIVDGGAEFGFHANEYFQMELFW